MKQYINPSTLRARRRVAVQNAIARRITGDPGATWSKFSSMFTDKVFPPSITMGDLNEKAISEKLVSLLEAATKNAKTFEPGTAQDLVEILQNIPRKKKKRKTSE